MNTTDLIDRIAAEHDVAKDYVRKILDSTFGAITAAAMRGDEVALSGFGKFKVTERAERQGRNPATGEAITIPAGKKLSFMPAKKPPRCAQRTGGGGSFRRDLNRRANLLQVIANRPHGNAMVRSLAEPSARP